MYGIYLICGKTGLSQEIKERLRLSIPKDRVAGQVVVNGSGSLAACLAAPKYRIENSSYVSRDGAEWILVDGAAIDGDSHTTLTARALYQNLREEGLQKLQSLNGEFLIAANIDGKTWLVSDRMGQRQHCMARNGEHTAIAPTPGAALRLVEVKREIDPDALLTFLISNKLRWNEQAIWRNCQVLPGAVQISFSSGGEISESCYWQLSYRPDSSYTNATLTEEAARIFRQAVACRLPEQAKVGLTLTGGLDSRLMAGAVPRERRKGILCSTMGIAGCDEIELARQVSEKAGYIHREVTLDGSTAFSPDNADYLNDEDIDLIIQNTWQHYLKRNSDCDVLLHGLDLDVTLGGIYLTPELEQVKSFDQLLEYALKNALSASFKELSALFRTEILTNAHDAIKDSLSTMLSSCREESFLNTYDHFILRYSMHRVILQRYRSIRRHIDTLSPMYDRHLIELYLRMPPKERVQHGVFQPVLLNICPDLAGIPYQRTGLPPQVPREFWRAGQHIESQREDLLRKIAGTTQGGIYVPYLRYYTNIDEWLRFDKTWMRACDDLLTSRNSILRQQYLQPERIDELIAEHRSHSRSHMKILHILMSAELFLRRAAGADIAQLFEEISAV